MRWRNYLCGIKKPPDEFDNDVYQRTTIQDLPDDMLMEIFSYLSVDYCRTASLVCSRWNNLAFGTGNIQLSVTILNKDRSVEKSYRRLLSSSKRSYRHLKLVDCRHSLVSKVLTKFADLDSLMLSCDIRMDRLAKISQLCSNIRSLDIKFSNFEQTSKKSAVPNPLVNLQQLKVDITFLQSLDIDLCQLVPNVTSLTILFSEDLPVPQSFLDYFAPQLRELILLVNFPITLDSNIPLIWLSKFPLLKRFECHFVRSDNPYDQMTGMERILENCVNLQVAKFHRVTYSAQLTVYLSQSCVNLRELHLGTMRVTEEHIVQICRLQHLKLLHIQESSVEPPQSQRFQILDSLTDLSLHAASFDDSVEFNDFIRHAFPALRRLQLHNCQNSYHIAQVKFFRLQLLEEFSVRHVGPISWEFLVHLTALPMLRSVSLVCSRFSDYNLGYDPGIVSGTVRTLSILAELDDADLRRIVTVFPNLRLLKLRQTNGCTARGIHTAQQLVPECFFELPARY